MSKPRLNEEWTAYVVGRMHLYRISRKELADKCNYTTPYLSTVLNCNKEFESETSKEKTKIHIMESLDEMTSEILRRYYREYDPYA